MCLMVADLLEFVPVSRDLRLAAGTGHRLQLAFSQSLGLYLGVYMHAPKRGQVWSNGASSLRALEAWCMLEVQPSSSEAVHKAKKTERFPGRLDGEAAALGGSDFVLQALQGTCALALGVEFPGGLSSFTSCVLGMLPEQMCRGKGLKGAKSMEMSRACVCVGLLGVHKCISACCQTLISVQLPLGAVNNKVSRTGMTALICGTACPFASLEDWSAELCSVHCDVRCPPSALPAPVGTCRAWFAAAALWI